VLASALLVRSAPPLLLSSPDPDVSERVGSWSPGSKHPTVAHAAKTRMDDFNPRAMVFTPTHGHPMPA
jgi:hypothetical protein